MTERYIYEDRRDMLMFAAASSTRHVWREVGDIPYTVKLVKTEQNCSRATAYRLLERMVADGLMNKTWRDNLRRYEYRIVGEARQQCEDTREAIYNALLVNAARGGQS